jgi:hypothetical protein
LFPNLIQEWNKCVVGVFVCIGIKIESRDLLVQRSLNLVNVVSGASEIGSQLTATAAIATMAGGSSTSPIAASVSREEQNILWFFRAMLGPRFRLKKASQIVLTIAGWWNGFFGSMPYITPIRTMYRWVSLNNNRLLHVAER